VAGAGAAVAGAGAGARGVALGGRVVHGAREGGGEVGVEADDAADVVVELADEADVAGEVVGRPGLVVLVDLADEHPVLVQQALHLHEAPVERVDQLPVHHLPAAAAAASAAAVRHGAAGEAVAFHGPPPLALSVSSPHRLLGYWYWYWYWLHYSPGLNINETNKPLV
jgi:hypothetical protein